MNNSANLPLAVLNWDEIREMSDSGLVEFGCHTATHRKLHQLPEHQVKEELAKSKKSIESNLVKPCDFFSYPRGRLNDMVINEVKNAGFKAGVIVKEGRVGPENDLYKLPRFGIFNSTGWWQFLGKISGW